MGATLRSAAITLAILGVAAACSVGGGQDVGSEPLEVDDDGSYRLHVDRFEDRNAIVYTGGLVAAEFRADATLQGGCVDVRGTGGRSEMHLRERLSVTESLPRISDGDLLQTPVMMWT